MTSKGIDYGMGKTNIDADTGIRFGVIHQNHILQAWSDESEAEYPDPLCEDCGQELELIEMDQFVCSTCKKTQDADVVNDCLEPVGWYVDKDGYQASSDEQGDVFVTKAPFYTHAQFCSPCAPGACYLTNPCEPDLNNRAYCFGHDWFEDGKAPYPVYSVETGKEVQP